MSIGVRKQRILDAIGHRCEGRFPTQLIFSPTLLDRVAEYLGVPAAGEDNLMEFTDSHFVYAYPNDALGKLRRRIWGGEKIIFDDWGVGYDMSAEGLCFCRFPLEDEADITRYQFPDPDREGMMDFAREAVEKFGDSHMVTAFHHVLIFERYWTLRGMENAMTDLLTDRDMVEDVMDKITDYQVRFAENFVKAGVGCARTGDDYGCQTGMLISPELWRELIKPRLARIWKVYKDVGLPIVHHTCGDVRPIIPDLIEMGLDILNDCQPEAMPIEELSEQFGDKIAFYGGLSTQKVMPFGTREEIFEEVRRAVEILGKYKGFILSPGIALTSDVPFENIIALLDAFRQLNIAGS